ncbi:hypothetical protein HPB50_019700 [Hyalomma asiaticum]|uniref:Uncharacterized protein n=1 Tax=Hyalomma asiaticum TaxID=266040 RepID=A0ACB7S9S8_HYAAI|nr:hypothetical protein HPB50_019700 [Hyalomma asiaticum]
MPCTITITFNSLAAEVPVAPKLLPDLPDAPLVKAPTNSPRSTTPDDQHAAPHAPVALATRIDSTTAEASGHSLAQPPIQCTCSLPPEAHVTGDAMHPAPAFELLASGSTLGSSSPTVCTPANVSPSNPNMHFHEPLTHAINSKAIIT